MPQPKPSDRPLLPARVLSFATAHVASGRYASVAAVLEAGVDALAARDQAEAEWLNYARSAAQRGIDASEQGKATRMSRTEFSVWLRDAAAKRAP